MSIFETSSNPKRWSEEETRLLVELREMIGQERLQSVPQFQEVVGDRKLLRFLRGHDYNVSKVADLYRKFLDWRRDNGIDNMRQEIVHKGLCHPRLFPGGAKILKLVPQIVIASDARDVYGCPLVVDQYTFYPSEVFAEITIDEYMVFVHYCLEFRSLVLEQLSEEKERKIIESGEIDDNTPYGVLLYTCVIRDLKGVGLDHLGNFGREVISRVVQVASDNYPELMRKCYIVNAPFVFYAAWYFIQGLLSAKTVAKICVLGTDFTGRITRDVSLSSLPKFLKGTREEIGAPFEFDTTEGGLLGHHPADWNFESA